MRLLFFLQLPEDNESFFSKKKLYFTELKNFHQNKFSGSISSFWEKSGLTEIEKKFNFRIEFYKKMAYYQAEEI